MNQAMMCRKPPDVDSVRGLPLSRYTSGMNTQSILRERPRGIRRSKPRPCTRKLDGTPLHEYQPTGEPAPAPWRHLRCRWCDQALDIGEPRLFD